MRHLLLSLLIVSLCPALPSWSQTALDDYVARVDEAYKWELVSSTRHDYYTYHLIRLQSLQWRSADEVDRPIWEHWLGVIVPFHVTEKQALLHICGGHNENPAPDIVDQSEATLAWATNSIVAQLRMIPNQFLRFTDEHDPRYLQNGRREDQMVAYTWKKYLETNDPTWIATFPMTKAVVRAIDTLQEFAKQELYLDLDGFVLAGASKRGWTAWMTAAVDPRVTGVAAAVIDLLNLKKSIVHHFRAYGFWSPALCDYVDVGINHQLENPVFDNLLCLIEPLNYSDRLTMPKLVLNATGDDFFTPDSSCFYFGQLEGPKYLRYVPNTNHNLIGPDALKSAAAFYAAVIKGQHIPCCQWELSADGVLKVDSDHPPRSAKLWSAHNRMARDFRLSSIGPTWTSTDVEVNGQSSVEVQLHPPEEGWAAYMIELTFDGLNGLPIVQTTDVFILPDHLPFSLELLEHSPSTENPNSSTQLAS